MNVRGYSVGPIACRAAFTADFSVPPDVTPEQLVNHAERDRPQMDGRPGMRHKYTPLRFDPAVGTIESGGRYLFDRPEDAIDYFRFTTSELQIEPGVFFWDRPFFLDVDMRVWHVIGAEDFAPIATHYVNRLERLSYAATTTAITGDLAAAWLTMSEQARRQGLATAWLLIATDDSQIGIVTAATKSPGNDAAQSASRSLAQLERTESLSRLLPPEVCIAREFDRTGLTLSVWLPKSRIVDGDAAAFPTYPLYPRPLDGGSDG